MDKAGKGYWDNLWKHTQLPKAVDPLERGLNNYVNRKFHDYFRSVLSSVCLPGKQLLEIGCARSAWLPYFAKEFGFEVFGLDYSALGCEQARQILANEQVKGEVVCGDALSPPTSMIKKFDAVVSFGVVEHFEDTTKCLSTFSKLLKPGGVMITTIPNLAGLNGALQKRIDREVFDIHVPLNDVALAQAHRAGGLNVLACDYFLLLNLNVLVARRAEGRIFHSLFVRLCSWLSKSVWILETFIPSPSANRWSSPYINCLALKPCA